MKRLLVVFTLFISLISYSQQYVDVLDETVRVNSISSLTGYTRNITRIQLPSHCIGYIYRLTVDKVEGTGVSEALFTLLKKVPEKTISWGASLAEYAVNSNDGEAVDAFIFNNTYDADNFYAKKDGSWNACRIMNNRMNVCFATKDCQGSQVYFGFRNNNLRQGLKVRLEVVAVIDTTETVTNKYSYTIVNETGQDIKYELSADNTKWEAYSLSSGYMQTPSVEYSKLYIRITTNMFKSVKYEIHPGIRYKIAWNSVEQKWDLYKY